MKIMSTSAIDPVVADAPVDSTPAAAVETTPATKDAAGGAVSAVVEQKSSGEVKENTDAQVPAVTEETKSGEETKVVSKDAEKDKAGEETKTAVKVEEKSKTGAKVTESKTNGEKPRGRGQFNHRNNSKAILDALPVTDDPVAIRKQVCHLSYMTLSWV